MLLSEAHYLNDMLLLLYTNLVVAVRNKAHKEFAIAQKFIRHHILFIIYWHLEGHLDGLVNVGCKSSYCCCCWV